MLLNIIDGVQIENAGPVHIGLNGNNITAIVPKTTAINLVKKKIFKDIGIFDNSLNLFSISSDVVNGEVNFMSFKATPFGLRPRKNGCAWNPTLKAVSKNDRIKTFGVEGMLQQCADELFGSTLRRLLGKGYNVYNILSTPESKALFVEAIIQVYGGSIMDVNSLTWFGKHPLVATAFANATSYFDAEVLQRFYELLSNENEIGGIITAYDKMRSDGIVNFTVPINPNDVLGREFRGNARDLFRRTKAAAPYEFRMALAQRASIGKFLVTRSIFDKYKTELGSLVLESSIQLTKEGAEYLMYDGHMVIPMDVWDQLDIGTKTNNFRVIFTAEENFLAAYDVPGIEDAKDLGMVIEQSSLIKDKGQVFGITTLDLGFGIGDINYTSYAMLSQAA